MNPVSDAPRTLIITALALQLLCFFIYMNSLLPPDVENSPRVLDAVRTSISATSLTSRKVNDESEQPGTGLNSNELEQRLQTVHSHFPTMEMNVTGGLDIRLELPTKTLFTDNNQDLRAAALPFLKALTVELTNEPFDISIRSTSYSEFSNDGANPSLWQSSLGQLGALLRYFSDEGIAKRRLDGSAAVQNQERCAGTVQGDGCILIAISAPPGLSAHDLRNQHEQSNERIGT